MPAAKRVRAIVLAVLAIALGAIASPAGADQAVLEMFIGRWNVRVKTLQPSRPDVTYVETYEWVLGRKFLSGRTEQKSDGTEDRVFIGYDPNSGIFKGQLATDASGYVLIDSLMRTNVEGVFAAGEIHDSIFRQAITAAGQGCAAALISIKWLQDREAQLQPITEAEAVPAPAAGD